MNKKNRGKEMWAVIPGCQTGLISSWGRTIGKGFTHSVNSMGYDRIVLPTEKKTKTILTGGGKAKIVPSYGKEVILVHRLVYDLFGIDYNPMKVVHHKDSNPKNMKKTNLKPMEFKEHISLHLKEKTKKEYLRGVEYKLYSPERKYIDSFNTQTEVASYVGLRSPFSVFQHLKGNPNFKTFGMGGYSRKGGYKPGWTLKIA